MKLRLVSYLAPSLPEALFECFAEALRRHSSFDIELSFDNSVSGPRPGHDPFSSGEYDGAFLCAPSVRWLVDSGNDPIRVVPAAPVFEDPRLGGKPRYFSDVVVRRDDPAESFGDLLGRRWGYNDPCSLSGYFSGLQLAKEVGESSMAMRDARHVGSHLDCLDAIINGEIDAAAIDSNTWLWRRKVDPRLDELRVITSAGPYPVQPLVVARRHQFYTSELAEALNRGAEDGTLKAAFKEHGVAGFAPVTLDDYTTLPLTRSPCSTPATPRPPAGHAV